MMPQKRLYTIEVGAEGSEPRDVQVKATDYLTGLAPHEAIHELQQNVMSLAIAVEEAAKTDLEVPENLEKVRDLVFQLEVAQNYLAQVFESWKAERENHGDTERPQ